MKLLLDLTLKKLQKLLLKKVAKKKHVQIGMGRKRIRFLKMGSRIWRFVNEKHLQKEKSLYPQIENFTQELRQKQNVNFAFTLLHMQTVGW